MGERSSSKTPPGILYNVGYEGRSAEQLLDLLELSQVEVLIDVRLNPLSRKPGLSKTRLAEALAAKGIEYVHEPLLGNPKENRDGFSNGHLAQAKAIFAARLSNGSREAFLRLVERARGERVAMLCVESGPERCHRQVIAEAVQDEAPDLIQLPL